MSLKQVMVTDATSVFVNADDFAETVTYYAGGVGDGRVINAVIERDVQTITDEGIPALATYINVVNSDTDGISSTEIDTGFDKIGVSLRYGESAQIRQVARVTDSDEGMIRVEVY